MLQYHANVFQFEFLHDLDNGQVNDETIYIENVSISVIVGGLWGDFTSIFWVSQYLQ
jgi:hypothetical protein